MFFESKHSFDESEFSFRISRRLDFPVHIHRSFEYYKQIEGSTEIVISNKKYVLQGGEAVLVFPLQPHSYTCIEEGKTQIAIFSPEMVSAFVKSKKNLIPADNRFICSLSDDIKVDNIFYKKAVAYFICGEFDNGREYIEMTNRREDNLLVSLLLFADANFRSPCLLRDAAEAMNYDYAYISKFFKRRMGMSFKRYVNSLRIIESKQMLQSSNKSVSDIGAECGFSSMRTFDREFYSNTGMTPSNYKKLSKPDME